MPAAAINILYVRVRHVRMTVLAWFTHWQGSTIADILEILRRKQRSSLLASPAEIFVKLVHDCICRP